MASSSVSQDDIENNYERLERRSRIRTARARQINPQVCVEDQSGYGFNEVSGSGSRKAKMTYKRKKIEEILCF